jgi:hypothetical protein
MRFAHGIARLGMGITTSQSGSDGEKSFSICISNFEERGQNHRALSAFCTIRYSAVAPRC